MTIPVPLDELATALERRSNAAYLLTVGDDGRPHCVASTVKWVGEELAILVGTTSARNAASRGGVVLLSPPAAGLGAPPPGDSGERGGDSGERGSGSFSDSDSYSDYSLIVDAQVTATSALDGAAEITVRARPTHAVLHRPAVASGGQRGHDCVHVYEET